MRKAVLSVLVVAALVGVSVPDRVGRGRLVTGRATAEQSADGASAGSERE